MPRLFALLTAALACPLAGCLSVHVTRPVDIVVTHADTGEPAAGVQVATWHYKPMTGMLRFSPLNEPVPDGGTTGTDGRLTLPLADLSHMQIKTGKDVWKAPDVVVRHGGELDQIEERGDPEPKYHVRLVARKPCLVQHLLPPYAPWYGGPYTTP